MEAPAATLFDANTGTYDEAEVHILNAAHRVFLRHGTSGARMQEIANEAGVTKSSVHYYFRSKDRLADAVFKRALEESYARFRASLDVKGPFEDTVRGLIASNLEMIKDYPYLAGYIMTELHQQPERAHQAAALIPGCREEIETKLATAIERGEIRPTTPAEFSTDMLSLSLFPSIAEGFVRALAGLDKAGWQAMMADRVEHVTAFYLRAMRV